MKTWRDATDPGTAAITTWEYDGHRGWLTDKQYANGRGPNYTYTGGGRLFERHWAREIAPQTPLLTSYTYSRAGDLASLSYIDGLTPDVNFGYDRRGRLTEVTNGTQRCTIAYSTSGNLLSETWSDSLMQGLALTNGFDQYLHRTNLAVLNAGSPLVRHAYGFDKASRLETATDNTGPVPASATYSYLAYSPMVSQIDFKTNSTVRMTTTKSYDYLNRLTSISSRVPQSSSLASFAYVNNSANQRIRATQADGSYWLYEYDPLGQVKSGKKYWADGTPVAGQQFEYGHDDIGNRKSTSAGANQFGANPHYASYAVNSLNQYTSRSMTGAVDVVGVALATNSVLVNGQQAYRKGEYFWKLLAPDNSSNPLWFEVYATSTNQAAITGHVFVAKTPEAFGYDADGNLTNDGRWTYTWDSENRLVKIEPSVTVSIPDAAKRKLEFTYDHHGRRIQKTVCIWTNADWTLVLSNRFVYDDWNLVAELNATNNAHIRSYLWGLDLSGTLQGAGGVGGLLAIYDSATVGGQSSTHFPCYDGNGNVVALLQGSTPTVTARYEYGPFGEVTRSTGPLAEANSFRFSTKYQDDETDLLYYGYRYYKPSTGRWLSRDRIDEAGGANLYGFIENDPISNVDLLGEKSVAEIGGDVKNWIAGHFSGRGGISYTLPEPKIRFLVYAPPPVWLEVNVTFAGEVFGCVHPQTHQSISAFKGSISVDGFVAVGISLAKGQPGPRNERIPNPNNPSRTVKRKNAPGEPNSGFRERNRYAEITAACTICPNEGFTGIEGSAFLRGSAGLGWGYQFNIQKAIDDSFTDLSQGWSVTGGRAWGTAGISIEAGVTVTAGVAMYLQ